MNRKRLRRLVDVKRKVRKAHQSVVAAADALLIDAADNVDKERAGLQAQRDRLAAGQQQDAGALRGEAALVADGRRRVELAEERRVQVAEQVELLRGALVEAAHDQRRMEVLRDKAQAAHARAERRREQSALDEIAARRGARS